MFGEMLDTTPEARRFYYAHLASLTPEQRARMAFEQMSFARGLVEQELRRQHPSAGAAELRVRLAVRLYGRELVEPVLGPAPADAR